AGEDPVALLQRTCGADLAGLDALVGDREADAAGALQLHARVVERAHAQHRAVAVQELVLGESRLVPVGRAVGLDDGEQLAGGHEARVSSARRSRTSLRAKNSPAL